MRTTQLLLAAALVTVTACGGSPLSPTATSISPNSAVLNAPSGLTSATQAKGGSAGLRKVTSGVISTSLSNSDGTLTLKGARFEITGEWTDGGSTGCQPCTSGAATIRTASSFSGTRGSAVVDGVAYPDVYLSGIVPVSGTVTIPAADTSTFTIRFPFSIEDSSLLIAYDSNPTFGQARELFRMELRGSGTATVELETVPIRGSSPVYTGRGLKYTF